MLLVLTVAEMSFAQRFEPLAASSRSQAGEAGTGQLEQVQMAPRRPNDLRGVAGGIVGGGAGFLGGMLVGASDISRRSCTGEDCGLANAILGSMIGEGVGLAVGAHYGARGRGNLALQIITSTAIGAAGLYTAWHAEGFAPIILTATPIVQLATVLAMEH
jgi:hypothetical protein